MSRSQITEGPKEDVYSSVSASASIGERLRREIGIDWLLTVTGSEEFLTLVERTPGQIWCGLWGPESSPEATDLYDAIVYYKSRLEAVGEAPRSFGETAARYRFRPWNRPKVCPNPEELMHLSSYSGGPVEDDADDDDETWDEEEDDDDDDDDDEDEGSPIGPGEIVIGALVSAIGIMAVNGWLKRREAEASRARELRYYYDDEDDDDDDDEDED